jgi:hypothetical protein
MALAMESEYAAFDFFVTAEHLVDWHCPGDPAAQKSLRQTEILLQVVSHLANGAKHFRATAKHHTSVAALQREGYAEDGYVESGYSSDVLTVELSQKEAQVLGYQRIEAYELALRVVSFWRKRLGVEA